MNAIVPIELAERILAQISEDLKKELAKYMERPISDEAVSMGIVQYAIKQFSEGVTSDY